MKKNQFALYLTIYFIAFFNFIYSQEFTEEQRNNNNINQPENSLFKKNTIDDYLIAFIDSGNFELVSYLLLKKANPNYCNSEGITPLMAASMQSDTNITKLLIRKGAFVNYMNFRGESALQCSVIARQVEQLKTLIGFKTDVNIKDLDGISPIFYALGYSKYDLLNYTNPDYISFLLPDSSISTTYNLLQSLTKSGADINLPNEQDCTPLLFATFQKDTSLINTLCKLGANPNKTTQAGVSPLIYAIQDKSIGVIKTLVKNRADVDFMLSDGNSALFTAVRNNSDSIAEFLLNNHAKVNLKNNQLLTPLHYAAGYGYPYLTALLINYGAKNNEQDVYGNTPLMSSVYSGAQYVTDILIDSGADANLPDKKGNTPLMVASQFNDTLLIKRLLYAGVDLKTFNRAGLNALNIAIENNSIDAYRMLVELGANITDSTLTRSYYQHAREVRSDDIADFIVSKGLKTKIKPNIGSINFYIGSSISNYDFMFDIGGGIFEPISNVLFNLGYKYRPYSSKVLVYENSIFYQLWEKRNSIYLSVQHLMVLRNRYSKGNFGFIPGLSGELSWNYYRGYDNNTGGKFYIIPSIGLFYKSNRFTLIGKWEFANYRKQIHEANRFSLQFVMSIPTRKSFSNKRIDWLD